MFFLRKSTRFCPAKREPRKNSRGCSPLSKTTTLIFAETFSWRSLHAVGLGLLTTWKARWGKMPYRGALDETTRVLDKTSDPVRLYLREIGSVPLLRARRRGGYR